MKTFLNSPSNFLLKIVQDHQNWPQFGRDMVKNPVVVIQNFLDGQGYIFFKKLSRGVGNDNCTFWRFREK